MQRNLTHHIALSRFPPRARELQGSRARGGKRLSGLLLLAICGLVATAAGGCGTAGNPPSQSAPPANVTVSIQPGSASLLLGATQQFQVTVTGTSNTAVTWEVNGIPRGNTNAGTISAVGPGTSLYTAPQVMPAPPIVTVTAVSQADAAAADSATVNLKDDIAVSISPLTATVPTAGGQVFTASVSGSGSFATGVIWSVNGITGGNATVGTIVAAAAGTALYAAPAVPPATQPVIVTASSVADNSKFASADVTVTCAATNSVSPASASVALGNSQTFTATFCVAAGTAIVWDVNGIIGGNATVGTIVPTIANTAIYSAPADLPLTNPVMIHGTAEALSASAAVALISHVSVSVSPPSATLSPTQRNTFAATVSNTSDASVTWSVNGVPNGSSAVGLVCQSGSNPCGPPVSPAASVDYIAPSSAPTPNPVTLLATSHADPLKSGAAVVTIAVASGPVAVAISPAYAFLAPSGGILSTQQFFATISGTANTSVTWSVQSAVVGQGCAGAACGSVSASGLYSAPTAAPSPNAIAVTATSLADATKSASATIALTNGPMIDTLLPSSVIAGAVESIPFEVQGENFVAGSGSTASAILLNGSPRATTCPTATVCTMALNPSDVQSAGVFTVQAQNPGSPGALSNPVPFVIVPFDVSVDSISLGSTQPSATGINIIVTEPTTAAASSAINVQAVGFFTSGNSCGVQGSPLTVTRPSSGGTIASICIFGNGLDPSFTYAFTGPGAPPGASDIGVTASAVTGLFPGMIELDLQISSTTIPGVRSLFVTTLDNDHAVATGFLEVK